MDSDETKISSWNEQFFFLLRSKNGFIETMNIIDYNENFRRISNFTLIFNFLLTWLGLVGRGYRTLLLLTHLPDARPALPPTATRGRPGGGGEWRPRVVSGRTRQGWGRGGRGQGRRGRGLTSVEVVRGRGNGGGAGRRPYQDDQEDCKRKTEEKVRKVQLICVVLLFKFFF